MRNSVKRTSPNSGTVSSPSHASDLPHAVSHSPNLENNSAVLMGFFVLAIGHLTRKYTAPGIREFTLFLLTYFQCSHPQLLPPSLPPSSQYLLLTGPSPHIAKLSAILPDVVLVVNCIYHPVRVCAPATTHDDDCARSSAAHGGAHGCQAARGGCVAQRFGGVGCARVERVWSDGEGLLGPR